MDSLLEYVLGELTARSGEWPEIAKGSDVPYSTVKKIALRDTGNPGVLTVEKLARYFREQAAA